VPDRDEAVQLEHRQGADQFLLPVAQRSQFLFQDWKQVALQNLSEAAKKLE
jgi:hypothetical protein